MNPDLIVGSLAVIFVGLVVLVPVLGLTLRFAIKPFFDSWIEIQRARVATDRENLHERQLSLLDSEMQQMQSMLRSMMEAQEFQRQLQNPESHGSTGEHDHLREMTARP